MTRPLLATIEKDFEFSASHVLAGLPEDHPCGRVHGHNYKVRVSLTGYVQPVGFVVDYRRLGWFKEYLDTTLDHRHLNDVLTIQPSAELLAEHLARKVLNWVMGPLRDESGSIVRAISVGVSETPKTWATVVIEAGDEKHWGIR